MKNNAITSFLKHRLVDGGTVIGLSNAVEQGLRLARNIVLARILAPEIFGVMAIVLAINVFLESLTEVGVKEAIIHHERGREKAFLNSAWWFAAIRSVVLYGITLLLAPVIANFYDNPDLIPLMYVAFLAILFRGLMSIQSYVLVKDMQFKKWAFIHHGGGIGGILITVILAIYLENVWALVIGFVSESFLRFIFSHITCPFRPSIKMKKEEFHELFNYAKGMLGLPILTFIFLKTDLFVIGKLHTNYELGLYTMAVTLAYIPLQFLSTVISDVAMPRFSSLQKNHEELCKSLIKVTFQITCFSLPIVVFIIFYSESILTIVYGTAYATVSIPFSILAIMAFFRLLSIPIAGLYMAIGEPGKHRYFTIIRAVLIILFMYPAVKYFGLIGAALAGLLAMFIGFILQLNRMNQILSLNTFEYFKTLIPSLFYSSIVIMAWALTQPFTLGVPLAELIIGITSFLVVYLIIILIHLRFRNYHIIKYFHY